MSTEKKTLIKSKLHPRNRNKNPYDLNALINCVPDLRNYLVLNKFGIESINFSNPIAVKLLNKSLLYHYYGLKNWDFPDKNLCPPIPGRADYIHYVADLLKTSNQGKIPKGEKVKCLDIGTGASCIYPIIGQIEYGWNFVGSDIYSKSINAANKIINLNPQLQGKIECRHQNIKKNTFKGIINQNELFDLIVCNPPFHSSLEEAQKGTRRKVKNLSGKDIKRPKLNFAGISNELIYEGGELNFIQTMIKESKNFSRNVLWFTSLVSKQANIKKLETSLKQVNSKQIKVIPMGTGNKTARIIAWTFKTKHEQKEWFKI